MEEGKKGNGERKGRDSGGDIFQCVGKGKKIGGQTKRWEE